MASNQPVERLQQLENIEKEIANAISSAGKSLEELAKDKPQLKTVDSHTSGFMKTLEAVEAGLMKQINYLTQVSTGQPHEGSSYAAHKDMLMSLHRKAHVKSRLDELEKISNGQKSKQLQLTKSYSLPPMAHGSAPGTVPSNVPGN